MGKYRTPLGKTLTDQGRKLSWLARKLQVHTSTIMRWAKGESVPPYAYQRVIAEELGRDIAELFPED